MAHPHTYVIAFDFESFGPIPNIHGFTELGAVVGDLETGEIVDTFRMSANQSGYTQDKECIETFWNKHPGTYEETIKKCSESDKKPREVVDLFVGWIRDFVENKSISNIYLLTDCATYDSGILKTFSSYSTLKIINNDALDIIDSTSFYLGIARVFMTNSVVSGYSFECALSALNGPKFISSVSHDHNPVNDATVIFEKWFHMNKCLK